MADAEKAAQTDAGERIEGGSYDVIRKRLLDQSKTLLERANALNDRRTATFGGSQLSLAATERVRTENNCVPRDIRAVSGKLLFGFNVFIGMKTETHVADVFSVHDFVQNGDAFELPAVALGEGHYLSDPNFVKEFTDLYRYSRDARLLQIHTSDTRLLAIFQTGASARDRKVFRFGVDKGGAIKFIDARGEEDFTLPRQHDFTWKACTREDQVPGEHAHYAILNEVFVDTLAGDLTIKIENNTKEGRGIYREPVEDANQSLDDAEVHYAKVGVLVLLKIKPYRETRCRYFVFNTRTKTVVRIDAIEFACIELPEDQGIIFPGGYYLRTGDYKVFDGDTTNLTFRRAMKSPNGEDVLYVFDRTDDGAYLLLPWNLIRKEVQNPMFVQGYSVFDDGKMVVFRVTTDEPTRVHTMQIWQTPFCTQEHAAKAPTDGSYLAKVGNADLVRGISDALTLQRLASVDNPTRQTYDDVIASCKRMNDAYYWLSHEEGGNLAGVVAELQKTTLLIVDEFEKVAAIRRRSEQALTEAELGQEQLFMGLRPADMRAVEDFMGSLSSLRKQRGHLITLREMRYMNTARVDELEQAVVEQFDVVSKACVEFLLEPTALEPLLKRLSNVVDQVAATQKVAEIIPLGEDVDKVGEGLSVLSDIITGLKVDDATHRTRILEQISEAYGQLNRARATLAARRKELATSEGKNEFAAQFKLFGQSVVSALALCDTPEKCDDQVSKLLLSLEELEGRFSEFDEFLGDLATKREEVTDAIASKRQALLDERQKRVQNILSAADRIIAGIGRKARTLPSEDELNTYFASDAMVLKLRDLAKQLFGIGDSVKGDELESRLKTARQDALRQLRDKTDLFEGGDAVIKFGRHRFNVNTRPVELALVARKDASTDLDVMHVHLTGTDFFESIDDPALNSARDLWDQQLSSETSSVYRAEFLAGSVVFAAERNLEGLTLDALTHAQAKKDGLLELVRTFAQTKHDEGYERGVHDVDAALVLEKLIPLIKGAGLLRYPSAARSLACLAWADAPDETRSVLSRRGRSYGRLRARLSSVAPQEELARDVEPLLVKASQTYGLPATEADIRLGARYLVEELSAEKPRFVASGAAITLKEALFSEVDRGGTRREFDEDLRTLEAHPKDRLSLVFAWLRAMLSQLPDLVHHAHAADEAAVLVALDRRIEREPTSTPLEAKVSPLLGQHDRVKSQALDIRLDEFLSRIDAFAKERIPRFRSFRKTKQELVDRERKRLRLDEFSPRILSSFVRNRLIDEVYLPLIGDNLAKQLGAAGATKRTDLMGLLLLVSPPGYGKTTLMEYVANRLGLVFMKINGPALGHDVRSLDPKEAPNATARQEVDKVNLALEMGNNVMLYIDDIQHTHPEFLQKFISLCDAQRRIEGVWNGKTRTYDLRGKKFCVCMAGNPYTESGEKFRIPDMLANRADTYNLGDILEGKDDLFSLSYIENALTSNRALAPLSGREPADVFKIIKMAQGDPIPISELSHAYSSAEVTEMVEVLKRMFKAQKVLLSVNLQYIASASQDDNYRTEPPFKLQGSYRNMNKISEKIVAAHTEAEIEALIDDHYAGESQTLTTGAENNLLKLASMRGRMTPEQATRWEEIKRGFIRVKMSGGKEDDPVARVTGALGTLGEQLDGIGKSLHHAVTHSREPAELVGAKLDALSTKLGELVGRELSIQVERDPAILEILAQQLQTIEQSMRPLVEAIAESLVSASSETRSSLESQSAALKDTVREAAEQAAQFARSQSVMVESQAHQAAALERMQAAASQAQRTIAEAQAAAQAQARQMAEAQQVSEQMMQAQREAIVNVQQASAQAQQMSVAQQHAATQARELLAAQQHAVMQAREANQFQRETAVQAQQVMQAQHQQMQQAHQLQQQNAQQAQAQYQQAQMQQAQMQQAQMQQAQQQQAQQAQQQAARKGKRGQMSMPGLESMPPSSTLVQRPDASPEENEAIARAQQMIAQAQRAGMTPEAVAAVARVEHKMGELASLVRTIDARLTQEAHRLAGYVHFDTQIDHQSASNFYRWRRGGDVVREGGIFISTYRRLPDLKATVLIRVTMPGGVEFETPCIVEWSRPGGEKGPPWEQPGFGARFVELQPHARQIVDQFVAMREPILFEAK